MSQLLSNSNQQPGVADRLKEIKDKISAVEARPLDHLAWNNVFRCLERNSIVFSNLNLGQEMLARLEDKIPCLVESGQYADASRAYARMKQIIEGLDNPAFAQNYVEHYSQKETEFRRAHEINEHNRQLFNMQSAAIEIHTYYHNLYKRQCTLNFSLTLGGVSDPKQTIFELKKLAEQWQTIRNYAEANDVLHVAGTIQLCYAAFNGAKADHLDIPHNLTFSPLAYVEPKLLNVNFSNNLN